MKDLTIFYILSEEGQKANILQGNCGQQLQKIETPVTKELLNLPFTKVTANGEIIIPIGFTLIHKTENCYHALLEGDNSNYSIEPIAIKNYISYKSSGEPFIYCETSIHKFNSKQSVEDLYAWESNRINTLEDKQIYKLLKIEKERFNLEIKKKEHEQVLKNISDEIASIEQQRDIENKIHENLQKEREFIFSKGSQYLRALYNGKYLYLSQYLTELKDYNGLKEFVIDYGGNGSYSINVIPSTELMQEVQKLKDKGFDASIVTIESSPVDKDDNYYISIDEIPCIGILIHNFADKTDLYKRIE